MDNSDEVWVKTKGGPDLKIRAGTDSEGDMLGAWTVKKERLLSLWKVTGESDLGPQLINTLGQKKEKFISDYKKINARRDLILVETPTEIGAYAALKPVAGQTMWDIEMLDQKEFQGRKIYPALQYLVLKNTEPPWIGIFDTPTPEGDEKSKRTWIKIQANLKLIGEVSDDGIHLSGTTSNNIREDCDKQLNALGWRLES